MILIRKGEDAGDREIEKKNRAFQREKTGGKRGGEPLTTS